MFPLKETEWTAPIKWSDSKYQVNEGRAAFHNFTNEALRLKAKEITRTLGASHGCTHYSTILELLILLE